VRKALKREKKLEDTWHLEVLLLLQGYVDSSPRYLYCISMDSGSTDALAVDTGLTVNTSKQGCQGVY